MVHAYLIIPLLLEVALNTYTEDMTVPEKKEL